MTKTASLATRLCIALAIPASVPAPVMAQGVPALARHARSLAPGDEVRVRWDDPRRGAHGLMSGRVAKLEVVSVDGWQLVGRRGGQTLSIPYSTMARLERRVGTRPNRAPEMVIGSSAGFAAGFLVGALNGAADPTISGGAAVNRGLSTGVLIGAPLGALIAYMRSRSRGIYEDVGVARIAPAVLPGDDGSVRLSFQVIGR